MLEGKSVVGIFIESVFNVLGCLKLKMGHIKFDRGSKLYRAMCMS